MGRIAWLLAAAAIWVAMISAPIAAANPQCVNTGPNTTLCQNPGNAQIVTTPSPATLNPYPWGWPYGGGLVISFGGR